MTALMSTFPPDASGQVTLANWRTGPFNRWAFHHVREIVASADIANDPDDVWDLPHTPVDFGALHIGGLDRAPIGIDEFLTQTDTDGIVVLHRGRIVFERYCNGMTAASPHILMSVSKSVLGLAAGILGAEGTLDVAALITAYVPEVAATAYAGATVRDLLDMRAGVLFDEDYLVTSGPIVDYRKATNWNPLGPGDTLTDLRSFFTTLTQSDGDHGQRFHYVSPNTDLLAWVIERASGKRYADILSESLFKPMGAERSGYITVDRLGAPRAAGGLCMTTRDLARLGQLLVQDGRRGGNQVIPENWISDICANGDRPAWDKGDFAADFPGMPIAYRSKWYVLNDASPILFGIGIHGQNLYVDRANQVVIAKFSSRAAPVETGPERLSLAAAGAIRDYLLSVS